MLGYTRYISRAMKTPAPVEGTSSIPTLPHPPLLFPGAHLVNLTLGMFQKTCALKRCCFFSLGGGDRAFYMTFTRTCTRLHRRYTYTHNTRQETRQYDTQPPQNTNSTFLLSGLHVVFTYHVSAIQRSISNMNT